MSAGSAFLDGTLAIAARSRRPSGGTTGRPRWLQELSVDGGHTWVEDGEMAVR